MMLEMIPGFNGWMLRPLLLQATSSGRISLRKVIKSPRTRTIIDGDKIYRL